MTNAGLPVISLYDGENEPNFTSPFDMMCIIKADMIICPLLVLAQRWTNDSVAGAALDQRHIYLLGAALDHWLIGPVVKPRQTIRTMCVLLY